jgi:hypothetical protein
VKQETDDDADQDEDHAEIEVEITNIAVIEHFQCLLVYIHKHIA